MKKFLSLLMVSVMLLVAFAGCASQTAEQNQGTTAPATTAAPAGNSDKPLKFGVIAHDRAIEWVNYGVMNFEWACKQLGVTPVVVDAQNNMEKVLAGMEDLLSQKVDAVTVYSFSPDLDARVAKMARDAGIPIVFENAVPADSVDRDSVTVCRYSDIGYAAAKYISEKYPKKNFVYIMGQPGMNITEQYQEGIKAALKDAGANAAVLIDEQPTNWTAEEALNVTQNVLQSGKKIDVIFANNEQIAQGVISALKDAGKFGQIPVIATGGSDLGVKMIQDGELQATLSAPVSFQGMMQAKKLWALTHGQTVEKMTNVPLLPVTKDNLDQNVGWNPTDKVVQAVGGLK